MGPVSTCPYDFPYAVSNIAQGMLLFDDGIGPLENKIIMHKPLQHFHDELNQLFAKACEDHQNGLLDAAGAVLSAAARLFCRSPDSPLQSRPRVLWPGSVCKGPGLVCQGE